MTKAYYLEVDAGVRYWEDAYINAVADTEGKIPLRQGDSWKPIIQLGNGYVKNWPFGLKANIHYKLCDAGMYWLLDENENRIAQWTSYYVPRDILGGHSDYIILNIEDTGYIKNWNPHINMDDWKIIV